MRLLSLIASSLLALSSVSLNVNNVNALTDFMQPQREAVLQKLRNVVPEMRTHLHQVIAQHTEIHSSVVNHASKFSIASASTLPPSSSPGSCLSSFHSFFTTAQSCGLLGGTATVSPTATATATAATDGTATATAAATTGPTPSLSADAAFAYEFATLCNQQQCLTNLQAAVQDFYAACSTYLRGVGGQADSVLSTISSVTTLNVYLRAGCQVDPVTGQLCLPEFVNATAQFALAAANFGSFTPIPNAVLDGLCGYCTRLVTNAFAAFLPAQLSVGTGALSASLNLICIQDPTVTAPAHGYCINALFNYEQAALATTAPGAPTSPFAALSPALVNFFCSPCFGRLTGGLTTLAGTAGGLAGAAAGAAAFASLTVMTAELCAVNANNVRCVSSIANQGAQFAQIAPSAQSSTQVCPVLQQMGCCLGTLFQFTAQQSVVGTLAPSTTPSSALSQQEQNNIIQQCGVSFTPCPVSTSTITFTLALPGLSYALISGATPTQFSQIISALQQDISAVALVDPARVTVTTSALPAPSTGTLVSVSLTVASNLDASYVTASVQGALTSYTGLQLPSATSIVATSSLLAASATTPGTSAVTVTQTTQAPTKTPSGAASNGFGNVNVVAILCAAVLAMFI